VPKIFGSNPTLAVHFANMRAYCRVDMQREPLLRLPNRKSPCLLPNRVM
jgi:hypothetical protein